MPTMLKFISATKRAETGGISAMFATLAFFLIAVLLMLGVIADRLWGRFQRR